MYEIRSESVKTFITDRSIKLPRFQRKQTWKEAKNFQLCISIFNEYPLGMCIISSEKRKAKTVSLLLDGRQRRNALSQMYEDPEKIYLWALKFIGIKNNDQIADIEDKYYNKINDYIEAEYDQKDEEDLEDPTSEDEQIEEDEDDESKEEEEFDPNESGLAILLQIIKICHNKTVKGTGFTRPFDLSKNVSRLPYIENNNGKLKLSSKRVKTFIDEYQRYCDEMDYDQYEMASFEEYIRSRCDILDGKDKKFKTDLTQKWEAIVERMQIVDKIDTFLSRSFVGIIEVKDPSPSDAQKIFNIINTGGEPLSSVEILSAKPHWNITVENPSENAVEYIKRLYKRIGVDSASIVRWDYPATFYRRMGKNLIFPELEEKDDTLGKELTLGFKILSAIKVNGVQKESIEELGKKTDINWAIDIDKILEELSYMDKVMASYSYFKYFSSWKTTVYELSSEAVSINYLSLVYLDWIRKGKPVGMDAKTKLFQKNSFILWDRLIYEYVYKQWKGAADHKTANNINSFSSEPDTFKPIETNKWINLLTEIHDESRIDNLDITLDYMKPLLFHMYCMKKVQGPDDCEIEVDHILPKNTFDNSTIDRKGVVQNNLYNLGLLPKRDNISKSNSKLKTIDDDWLIDQIQKYEFIKKEDFEKYSNINNYKEMYKERFDIFVETYTRDRDNLLNN